MNDKLLPQNNAGGKRLNSRALLKAIYDAELPQDFVRSLPAQSLYMAVRQNGLSASADIIQMAGLEQCRLMMDFDCWQQGEFNEDNFWDWLDWPDLEGGLQILQKLIKFADLKLVSLLISKYVEMASFDEPTDNPPDVNFYTPDKGHTWIRVNVENSHRYFLLSRFLALIFETSAEVFYQLLAVPDVATASMLEEEAYQERTKRLLQEGIPDDDRAWELNTPLNEKEVALNLKALPHHIPIGDLRAVQPLVYSSSAMQPLAALLSEPGLREEMENELTLVMNAAIVRWEREFFEQEKVQQLADKVKGAINIGLEVTLSMAQMNAREIFQVLGLTGLYKLGLYKLQELRKSALKAARKEAAEKIQDSQLLAFLEAVKAPFPALPAFFEPGRFSLDQESGSLVLREKPPAAAALPGGEKPFAYLKEIEAVQALLNEI